MFEEAGFQEWNQRGWRDERSWPGNRPIIFLFVKGPDAAETPKHPRKTPVLNLFVTICHILYHFMIFHGIRSAIQVI